MPGFEIKELSLKLRNILTIFILKLILFELSCFIFLTYKLTSSLSLRVYTKYGAENIKI